MSAVLHEQVSTLRKAPKCTVRTKGYTDGRIVVGVFAGSWDGYVRVLQAHPSVDIVSSCARVHAKVIEDIAAGLPAPPSR